MITANIATIPNRKDMLLMAYNSIVNQVDEIYINTGIDNMGDGEKFKYIHKQEGYIFTCDDDIIYPPDYVTEMIDHIERFKRSAIVTLHGRTFDKFPIASYYRGRKQGYHWNKDQDFDVPVDSGGTGVMAWHSDTIKIDYKDIKHPNMGDVWMAVFARRAGIPIICVKHKADWLKYIGPPEDMENPKTIWSKHYNSDKIQTQIYNGC